MNWFRRFMIGRYGPDPFGFALILISLIISILGSITKLYPFILLSYLTFGWALFRMLSKNTVKRYNENMKFLKIWNPMQYKLQTTINNLKDTKTHRHYKCPNCKQKIRVPKGRGKINITCPRCKTKFIKKT